MARTRIKHGKPANENFYRMFPVQGTRFKTDALNDLASNTLHVPGDSDIPAGYTYFGQFVAHDISRIARGNQIPTTGPVLTTDLEQLSTPSLDLDSLYGDEFNFGDNIPFQYGATAKFWSESRVDPNRRSSTITDIPRNERDPSVSDLIGDSRNDENFLTAQIHVLFMNLHNKLVDLYKANTPKGHREATEAWRNRYFRKAREETTYLYQLVIQNDFLFRLLTRDVYDYLFVEDSPELYLQTIAGEEARVPIEFAGAVFRFGHSMIRAKYRLEGNHSTPLPELFELTGPGGNWQKIRDRDNPIRIDWQNLFDFRDYPNYVGFDRAKEIDMNISEALRNLKNELPGNKDLAARNLIRGLQLDLPSGQQIARYLIDSRPDYCLATGLVQELEINGKAQRVENIIGDPSRIKDAHADFKGACSKWGLWQKMPLWTYILVEPHLQPVHKDSTEQGNLGILGSIIVGEVFKSLIRASRTSIYDPDFNPEDMLFFQAINEENQSKGVGVKVTHENLIMSDLINFTYYSQEKYRWLKKKN